MDESKEGAAVQPIQTEKTEQPATETKVETITKADLQAALENERKQWQSRFDKALLEKKQVEEKALTIEQRFELAEKERKAEKVEWARKEAKAKAAISDDLESAARLFSSEAQEDIVKGAEGIRKIIDNETAMLKDKIADLEKQLKYGARPPAGGGGAVDGDHDATYQKILREQGLQAATKWHLANPPKK